MTKYKERYFIKIEFSIITGKETWYAQKRLDR